MAGYSDYLAWLAWVNPPRLVTGAAKTNVRVIATVPAAGVTTEIDNDLLMANTVPSQPAANQGELPGIGRVRIQMQCDHASNGLWLLFGQTNAVVVDNTDAAAAQLGVFVPPLKSIIFVINPSVDKFFAARAPAGQTSVLRYWIISQPQNNRP